MRAGFFLIGVGVLAVSVPAYAQRRTSPEPTGQSGSIVRTPPSSNGSSYGTSGNVGAPTSTYPQRLRDYNNPAASYGRFGNPATGVNRPYRR